MDNQNPNADELKQAYPQSPQPTLNGKPITAEKKIIQPSEALINEMASAKKVPNPQTISPQITPTQQSTDVGNTSGQIQSTTATNMPNGIYPEFDPNRQKVPTYTPVGDKKGAKSKMRKVLFVVIPVVLISAIIALIVIFHSKKVVTSAGSENSNLATVTMTNSNYTYSFKYYKGSTPTELANGINAYSYMSNSNAAAQPITTPLSANCSDIEGSWTEVFTVKVYGATEPVCMDENSNIQGFSLRFSALNSNHLFGIGFTDGAQSPSIYPTLKAMFQSISVSN